MRRGQLLSLELEPNCLSHVCVRCVCVCVCVCVKRRRTRAYEEPHMDEEDPDFGQDTHSNQDDD